MKPSLILTALALLLTSGGCRQEDPRPVSTSLFGEWQWVSSIGGLTGKQEDTPASTGDALTYTFNHDSTFVSCLGSKTTPTQCGEALKFTVRPERSLLFGTVRPVLTIWRKVYLAPPDTGFHILRDRYLINEISNDLSIRQDYPSGFGKKFRRK